MSDPLSWLVDSALGRSFLEKLGVPVPTALPRLGAALSVQPLRGKHIHVGGLGAGVELATRLTMLGAVPVLRGDGERSSPIDGLVFDASALATASGLEGLRSFLGPRVARLGAGGRVLVLGAADDEGTVEERAAQSALGGFTKSLARELERKGATANLVRIRGATEDGIGPAASFFLAERSAFVTAQTLTIEVAEGDQAQAGEKPLAGQTALVTGAAQGIGAATAVALAREGALVVCVDRPSEREALDVLVEKIDGRALSADLASQAALPLLAESITARGPLDIIVHNAGVTRDRTLARMNEAEWRAVLDVNLRAILTLTPLLVPALRDGGRIISLTSVTGVSGNVGQTAYGASKSGVMGFTRAMAWSLAPQRITVNAVAPGFIETRLTARLPFAIREAGRRLSALGQAGRPEDVAEAILFLTTPLAQGISGQTLRVCGGSLLGA